MANYESAYVPEDEELSTAQKMAALLDYSDQQAIPELTDIPDEYNMAFSAANAYAIRHNPKVYAFYESMFNKYSIEPRELGSHIPKFVQSYLRAVDPNFPVGYKTVEQWLPVIDALPYNLATELRLLRSVATNVPERGKLIKAAALLRGKSLVSMADLGCSGNLVTMHLALHGDPTLDLHYRTTPIVRRDTNGNEIVDSNATVGFNTLIQDMPFVLNPHQPSVGVDLQDARRDPHFRDQVRNDRFRMGEYLDKQEVARFNRLLDAEHASVQLLVEDVTTFNPSKLGVTYDVVVMSYLLWQLEPWQIAQTLALAEKWVADDGLIIVEDSIELPNGQPPRVLSRARWNGRLSVKDMVDYDRNDPAQIGQGYEEDFHYDEGRITAVTPQASLGKLALARRLGLVPQTI